jgi:hypothetical protein
MPVDFTKVPIGTKVETVWGPGKIVLTNNKNPYPVMVTLDNSDAAEMYTADGRYVTHEKRPTLFLAPFEWPTQDHPLLDLPVDTPIMVRNHEYESWGHRHFAAWKYGKVTTFTDGRTSFTENVTIDWEQWRLPTEEELKGIS